MIDLRSDTVTRPDQGMRAAMARAEVGDDVYAEDPTVAELEAKTAALLGQEAGLFCPTGSMANMLGVWLWVPPGREALCDQWAHVARAEMGGHGALHGVTMRTWQSSSGIPGVARPSDVIDLLSVGTGPYLVETAAVAIENTHNFGGGIIHPIQTLREISRAVRAAGVAMHLDGARLWNAHVATGVGLVEYGELFDSVSVCFSKGLGAPIGSVLVSSADQIARARIQRKRLGGGMRQVGVLAAAALYALEHNLARLATDHANARSFATELADRVPGLVTPDQVATNIVLLDLGDRDATALVSAARDRGLLIGRLGPHQVRVVTNLGVDAAACVQASRILAGLLAR